MVNRPVAVGVGNVKGDDVVDVGIELDLRRTSKAAISEKTVMKTAQGKHKKNERNSRRIRG